jgi:hypothetical protein
MSHSKSQHSFTIFGEFFVGIHESFLLRISNWYRLSVDQSMSGVTPNLLWGAFDQDAVLRVLSWVLTNVQSILVGGVELHNGLLTIIMSMLWTLSSGLLKWLDGLEELDQS